MARTLAPAEGCESTGGIGGSDRMHMKALAVSLAVGWLVSACGPVAPRAPRWKSHGEARFRRIVGVASTDIRGEGITMTLNFECVRTVTETYCDELVQKLYA